MTEIAMQAPPIEPAAHSSRPNLDKGFNPLTANLLMAWVLTLPSAIALSACLYVLLLNIF